MYALLTSPLFPGDATLPGQGSAWTTPLSGHFLSTLALVPMLHVLAINCRRPKASVLQILCLAAQAAILYLAFRIRLSSLWVLVPIGCATLLALARPRDEPQPAQVGSRDEARERVEPSPAEHSRLGLARQPLAGLGRQVLAGAARSARDREREYRVRIPAPPALPGRKEPIVVSMVRGCIVRLRAGLVAAEHRLDRWVGSDGGRDRLPAACIARSIGLSRRRPVGPLVRMGGPRGAGVATARTHQ
jgi:hypothetical protein